MDRRSIGVFDSGLGGLTTVRELMRILPNENIIYFGDTSRVPYGGRSDETILKYARQDVAFLQSRDIKAIVIACNTVDTTASAILRKELSLPMFGVVEPSVSKALAITKNKKIGLIGTEATIRSGAYEALAARQSEDVRLMSVACPLFTPLVENGRIHRGDIVIETVAAEYLKPLRDWGCDVLMLGCTHYALLEKVISAYMGEGVELLNSGKEAAITISNWLVRKNMLTDQIEQGNYSYYVSDSTENFGKLGSLFLQQDISGVVKRVDIDKY